MEHLSIQSKQCLDMVNTLKNDLFHPKNILLKETDPEKFNQMIADRYKLLIANYLPIFKMVMNNPEKVENDFLMMMLSNMDRLKSGQITKEQADKNMGELFAQRFVYPLCDMSKEKDIQKKMGNIQRRNKYRKNRIYTF